MRFYTMSYQPCRILHILTVLALVVHPGTATVVSDEASSGALPQRKVQTTVGTLAATFEAHQYETTVGVKLLPRDTGRTLHLTATEGVLASRTDEGRNTRYRGSAQIASHEPAMYQETGGTKLATIAKLPQRFLSVTKKIIIEGAIVGLEEAGARIARSSWPVVRNVISPVVDELERRYPNLRLIGKEEAKQAAEKAVEALSTDTELQGMLSDSLSKLEAGQEEILAALAWQDNTLQDIGARIDEGFQNARKTDESALAQMRKGFDELKQEFKDVRGLLGAIPSYDKLTIDEIYNQANTYQLDAMRWMTAKNVETASQRLAEGRNLLQAGLKRDPKNAKLLVSMGFIEKAQAQVSLMERDHDTALTILGEAAKYFVEALKYDQKSISAINGMANVY